MTGLPIPWNGPLLFEPGLSQSFFGGGYEIQKVGQMSMRLVVDSTMSAVLIYEPPHTARPPGNRIRLGTPVSWFGGWHWELEIGGWGGGVVVVYTLDAFREELTCPQM